LKNNDEFGGGMTLNVEQSNGDGIRAVFFDMDVAGAERANSTTSSLCIS
jgi:hypothetical protein